MHQQIESTILCVHSKLLLASMKFQEEKPLYHDARALQDKDRHQSVRRSVHSREPPPARSSMKKSAQRQSLRVTFSCDVKLNDGKTPTNGSAASALCYTL